MCQFQLDFEDDLKALLVEAFIAGEMYTAHDEGLRGAEPVLSSEEWAEARIRNLLTPLREV